MTAWCELVTAWGPLAGRVLMALIFLVSGFGKLTAFGAGPKSLDAGRR